MIDEELLLHSGTITLRGRVLRPRSRRPSPLVVLCHGIPSGQTVEGDPGYEALALRLVDNGTAACYFNFRGTGLSNGNFSLPGWIDDLNAVMDAAEEASGPFEGCDPGSMVLMGFSGGGAVGIICAARRGGLRGVAAISSPADFFGLITRDNMGAFIDHARSIGIIRDADYPVSEESYFEEISQCVPVEEVARLSPTHLLIIHGDLDDVVPVDEGRRLFEAAAEPKELYVVKGGGHKLRLNEEAMDKAVGWIGDIIAT